MLKTQAKTIKIFVFLVCVFGFWSLSFGLAQAGWTSGKYGSAINFDGINDYVNSNSNLAAASAFSYSFWFKSSDGAFAADEYLFSQGTNDPSVYLESTDNKIKVMADGADKLSSAKTVNNTEWHHLEITADGTNIKLYLDGILESSASYTGSSAAATFYVASSVTPGSYFGGIIDDIKVYNYARTQDEIFADYNNGKAAHLGKDSQRDDGLVGYWNMEEGTGQTISDRSGNSNNGTLGASAAVAKDDPVFTSGYSSAGAGGTALKFDGKDDYVDAGNGPSLGNGTDTTQLTIELWMKSNKTGAWRAITNGTINNNSYTIYGNNANQFVFLWGNGTTFDTAGTITGVPDTNWHHYVATFNFGTANIYRDGVNIGTKSSAVNFIRVSTATFKIGGLASYAFFNGSIDEVRIYNRALSADEIRQHYNQKKPVLDMKFDEGTGTSTKDESFNNNDGTITGATWTTGKYGSALDFDGIDDVVTVTQSSSTNLTSKTGYTISAWAYPHSDGEGDTGGKIIYKGANNYLRVDTEGSGLLDVEAKLDLATTDATLNIVDAVPINIWSHIVLTYEDDSDDEITIYINGINKGTSADGSGAPATDSNNLLIGGNAAANFDGLIDSVRIYSYARTQDEILADYNNGLAAHLGKDNQRDDGLVGYWNMEEGTGQTISDRSGNSNTGTLGGTSAVQKSDPVFSSGYSSAGAGGTALNFDGVNDYVDANSSTSLNFTNAITLGVWIKINTVRAEQHIIEKAFNSQWELSLSWYNVKVNTKIGGTYYSNYLITTTSPTSLNNWYYIVYTFDGTTGKIYVNGINKVERSDILGAIGTSASALMIGTRGGGSASEFFNGSIDEVRIYNRALSADEIRQHYNQKKPVLDMKFDEGSEQKAYDESFNNNDGWLGGTSAVESSDPTWTSGKYGSALSFDGTDDFTTITDSSILNLTTGTINIWFKWTGSANTVTLFNRYVDADNRIEINLGQTTGSYSDESMEWYMEKGNTGILLALVRKGHTYFRDSLWHNISAVMGTNYNQIYVDGVLQTPTYFSGYGSSATGNEFLNLTGTKQNFLGKRGNVGSPLYFKGLIDSVRVYNYARTQAEILTDYNDGLAAHLR